MPAGELSYRSTRAGYVAENRSVLYGSLAPPGRGYCNLFLALLAPGPRHPPRAAPKNQSKERTERKEHAAPPLPLSVRISAARHGYRSRRGRRGKGGCKVKFCSRRRMNSTAKMANRGKRGSRGERAEGRKEAVGYRGSGGKGGSKGHMNTEVQAYHRTGSHVPGDDGRQNHSQCKQHTPLLILHLLTTPNVHESRK